MRKQEQLNPQIIDRMADFVLRYGLGAATLRPLAAAAGTSDRMLLYYFKNKDEVIAAILHRIAERLVEQLERDLPGGKRRSFEKLLDEVWRVLSADASSDYMPVWLELAASAARGVQPHQAICQSIAGMFLMWIAEHLEITDAKEKKHSAAASLMVVIEGMYLLHAAGRPDISRFAKASLRPQTR